MSLEPDWFVFPLHRKKKEIKQEKNRHTDTQDTHTHTGGNAHEKTYRQRHTHVTHTCPMHVT